jgi:hypothetical protein
MDRPTPARINPSKLYLTSELAAKLRLHRRTLETWRRLNVHPELKWRRVGRHVRYLGADVLKFLDDSAVPPPKRRRQ